MFENSSYFINDDDGGGGLFVFNCKFHTLLIIETAVATKKNIENFLLMKIFFTLHTAKKEVEIKKSEKKRRFIVFIDQLVSY